MRPGDKDTLVIEPDATQLSYIGSRKETPALTLGVSDDRADYSFQFAGISDQPGSTFNLGLPPEGGNLNLQNVGAAATSSVNLKMTRSSQQGLQVLTHDAISAAPGGRAQLQFHNWTKHQPGHPLVITSNGQQSTQTLMNQYRQAGGTDPISRLRTSFSYAHTCRAGTLELLAELPR